MIYCLVAVEKNQGIGFNGQMPWPRLSGDMQWFKEKTTDNIVVMGSKTWKSLGKPLPNRMNVVISSRLHVGAQFTFTDPTQALVELAERYPNKDIFVIGGQQLYDSVKELVDTFYVTEILGSYECDKFFNLEYVKTACKEAEELLSFDSKDAIPSYKIKEYKRK